MGITLEQYNKNNERYAEELAEIQMREDQLDNADQNFYTTAGYLLAMFECSERLFEVANIDEKRQIVSLLLSNLHLDGKNFTFNLKEPFATLISQSKGSLWLGKRDGNITFDDSLDFDISEIESVYEDEGK